MKISRQQLRRLISEYSTSVAHPRGNLGKNIADVDFPIVVGYKLNGRSQSEIAYNQDELDEILDYLAPGGPRGRDIPYSLNPLDEMEPTAAPVGGKIERFAEIKQIVTRVLSERVKDSETFEVQLDSGEVQVVTVPYYIIMDALEDGLTVDGLFVEIEEYIDSNYSFADAYIFMPASETEIKRMHADYAAGGVLSDEDDYRRGFMT